MNMTKRRRAVISSGLLVASGFFLGVVITYACIRLALQGEAIQYLVGLPLLVAAIVGTVGLYLAVTDPPPPASN